MMSENELKAIVDAANRRIEVVAPDGFVVMVNGIRIAPALGTEQNPAKNRDDLPDGTGLVVNLYGNKTWYMNGELHRDNGPAIEWSNGDKEWWVNGALPAGDESWLPRLAEIAQLEPNWSENSEGEEISPSALIAAAGLLARVDAASDRAAIFPTPEGGVLVEWSTAEQIVNVEFLADGSFDLLHVPKGAPAAFEAGVQDFDQARNFVLERLTVK